MRNTRNGTIFSSPRINSAIAKSIFRAYIHIHKRLEFFADVFIRSLATRFTIVLRGSEMIFNIERVRKAARAHAINVK